VTDAVNDADVVMDAVDGAVDTPWSLQIYRIIYLWVAAEDSRDTFGSLEDTFGSLLRYQALSSGLTRERRCGRELSWKKTGRQRYPIVIQLGLARYRESFVSPVDRPVGGPTAD
jgi:hypothetical protein